MERNSEKGYATVFVLVLMAVLLMLLSLAMKINYRFHSENQKELKKLQIRADKLN